MTRLAGLALGLAAAPLGAQGDMSPAADAELRLRP